MAELNDFTEDLETQLTCAICNDIFTEPRTLPCLHTFCFQCIKSWSETCQKERKTLKCPTCRAAVNVEGGDISNLPSSFTYNSLLQIFHAMKVKAGQQNQQQLPECVNCSKRSVLVGFCPQCEGMICGECINAHKTMNTLKRTHQATLLKEFKKEHVNSYINNQSLCTEKFHDKCHLEYYCKTCNKCICQKCVATAHSTHDKVSIEEASENARMLIRKDKDRLNQLLVEYNKKLELSKNNMTRIYEEVDAEKAKVRSDSRALIKIVQDHEEALIANLDDILMGHTTTNDEEKGEINVSIQQLTELKYQCETMEDKNLEHFTLEVYKKLQDVCKTTVQSQPMFSIKPVNRISIVHYIQNPEVIPQMKDFQLGKIVESVTDPSCCTIESLSNVRCGFINKFSIVTRNSEGKECFTNKELVDAQIQDVDGIDVQKELTETQTGRFLVKYMAEKPSPYKVVVSVGGQAISNSPQNVDTIDAKAEFKPLRLFETKRATRPHSLALIKSGEIAVVNIDRGKDRRVVLFDADGEYLRRFGGEGTRDEQLLNPFGVVFHDDRILVADNQDKSGCIKEFGMDGTYKRTLCKLKGKRFLAMRSINNQSIACLGDDMKQAKASIWLFAKRSGDHLGEIKLDVPKNAKNGEWCPFVFDYANNKFFVSFIRRHCVFVFDDNGGLLYTFGEKGNTEGQFNVIREISVFDEELLLVCDANNHRVQVFTQGGKFITSFGSYGSSPSGIAVAPDGTVVLELYGKRVQLWR